MYTYIQVPAAKFRTWSQRRVSTDGGSYDYLRVRAESVPTSTFLQKWFRTSAKGETKSNKTRFLKKFDIRREPKGSQREAKREPKGAKREPKIKKIIKNHALERSKFSLSFFL